MYSHIKTHGHIHRSRCRTHGAQLQRNQRQCYGRTHQHLRLVCGYWWCAFPHLAKASSPVEDTFINTKEYAVSHLFFLVDFSWKWWIIRTVGISNKCRHENIFKCFVRLFLFAKQGHYLKKSLLMLEASQHFEDAGFKTEKYVNMFLE